MAGETTRAVAASMTTSSTFTRSGYNGGAPGSDAGRSRREDLGQPGCEPPDNIQLAGVPDEREASGIDRPDSAVECRRHAGMKNRVLGDEAGEREPRRRVERHQHVECASGAPRDSRL